MLIGCIAGGRDANRLVLTAILGGSLHRFSVLIHLGFRAPATLDSRSLVIPQYLSAGVKDEIRDVNVAHRSSSVFRIRNLYFVPGAE
jgi:hypothetical protein